MKNKEYELFIWLINARIGGHIVKNFGSLFIILKP